MFHTKSKFFHTLDSYVFSYKTASGSLDLLKIEINYSNRVHILEPIESTSLGIITNKVTIKRLDDEELLGSKLSALLSRTVPRDIYDTYVLFKKDIIKNPKLIKRICIFYVCLCSDIPIDFDNIINSALEKINNIDFNKVKRTLIPVLHKGLKFNVTEVTSYVDKIVKEFFVLDKVEKEFIDNFNNKLFNPDLLFKEFSTNDVSNHPMAIWKFQDKE